MIKMFFELGESIHVMSFSQDDATAIPVLMPYKASNNMKPC